MFSLGRKSVLSNRRKILSCLKKCFLGKYKRFFGEFFFSFWVDQVSLPVKPFLTTFFIRQSSVFTEISYCISFSTGVT